MEEGAREEWPAMHGCSGSQQGWSFADGGAALLHVRSDDPFRALGCEQPCRPCDPANLRAVLLIKSRASARKDRRQTSVMAERGL